MSTRLLSRSIPRLNAQGSLGYRHQPIARRTIFGGRDQTRSRRYIPFALAVALGASLMGPLAADEASPMAKFPQSPSGDPAASTSSSPAAPIPSIQSASLITLARSYFVYTLCSIPLIVDNAPGLLHAFSHSPIPGLSTVTEAIVRRTFFAQFVPGETVAECKSTMTDLRERGVGAMLNYSAEAEINESGSSAKAAQKDVELAKLEEVHRALDGLGEFEGAIEQKGGLRGSTCFALKITGLIDPDILHRASTTLLRLRPLTTSNAPSSPSSAPLPPVPYPGAPVNVDAQVVARQTTSASKNDPLGIMTLKGDFKSMGVLDSDEGLRDGDLEELNVLWEKLRGVAEKARGKGIKLMVDAEHTWYQPALDAYTLLLSEEFNRPPKTPSPEWKGPLIYGTYQSYLTRQPAFLLHAIREAEKSGFALGIKLVRGAYFVQEREKWKKEGREGPDPIWPDKPATDLAYHSSISTIISTMTTQLASPNPELALSVCFGTHNSDSVSRVIDELRFHRLAKEVEGGKLRIREDVLGKIFIAQLYGMKDDLMDQVTGTFEPSPMPVALKYIAYGKLSEVMPFLGRRAIENKSLMSGDAGAAAERGRILAEVKRRYF